MDYKCPDCGQQTNAWLYEGTTQSFCVKCQKPIFINQLPKYPFELIIGTVSRKWDYVTKFFRVRKGEEKEQTAIYTEVGRNLEMSRGDKIILVCEKQNGKLEAVFYNNRTVGQSGRLIPDTITIGKFKTGRFSSKNFNIPNPKFVAMDDYLKKRIEELQSKKITF